MATGKKTGGRNFTKGQRANPRGRPRGAKEKVPRSVKRTLQAMCSELSAEHPEVFKDALLKGVKGKFADRYLRIFGEYGDGGPPVKRTELTLDLSGLSDEEVAWAIKIQEKLAAKS